MRKTIYARNKFLMGLNPHISWVFEQKWFRYQSGQGARRFLSESIVGTMSKSKIFWQHSTDGYMGHFGRLPMKYAGKFKSDYKYNIDLFICTRVL